MIDYDGLIKACELLKWYCDDNQCEDCPHASTCHKYGVDKLSQVLAAVRADLIIITSKGELISAVHALSDLCKNFRDCSECPLGVCTTCPKHILAGKLNSSVLGDGGVDYFRRE